MTERRSEGDSEAPEDATLLARELCRTIGVNQNYASRVGTPYHIQIEDLGPVFDDAKEAWVRRVNVIAYANYGEPNARIVHGRDHDFPDRRTHEHNQLIARRVQELAAEVRHLLEERESRQVSRIKAVLECYYESRDEVLRREIEEVNSLYPFVFARAWQELKVERSRAASGLPLAPPEPEIDETVYPLDSDQRALVLEIERVREELERDLAALKARGAADDILLATCAKILFRAHESLTQRGERGSDFASRRLEMTKNSLVTTFRQVRARLTRAGGA
jgi:hypothetical protein